MSKHLEVYLSKFLDFELDTNIPQIAFIGCKLSIKTTFLRVYVNLYFSIFERIAKSSESCIYQITISISVHHILSNYEKL